MPCFAYSYIFCFAFVKGTRVVVADPVNEIIGIATVEGEAGLVTRIAEETATVGEIHEVEAGLVRTEIAGGTVGGREAETANEMSGGVTDAAADHDLAIDAGTGEAEAEAVVMIARTITECYGRNEDSCHNSYSGDSDRRERNGMISYATAIAGIDTSMSLLL